jgi:CRP-like cAMP-binding protein/tRNA A-37 threonylcarbamoyl transferase component Bud32
MRDSQATGKPVSVSRKPAFEPVPFGRHCLIDRISQGGMSDIYLAKSVGAAGFHKPVVIKKLLPRYSVKPRYVKRFLNEAKTLARLNHANIVQILDMGAIEGEYYLALEYIEGRNVAYLLSKAARSGQLPALEFALHVVLEVAKGLAYSHRKKSPSGEPLMLVHQDINSFNVMVSYEAEVKIIDFGIARMFLENDGMEGLPVAGKLLYFSPEQLQRRPVDRRVDIYGTGVLLYELLTGQRLVQHQETVKATVKAILEMDIRQRIESESFIRPELRPILIRAMALNPEDRYPWIEEMIHDIRAVIKQSSLELDTAAFSVYMKDQFRREILLDTQRLKAVMAEDEETGPAAPTHSVPARGFAEWKDVDLVAAVIDRCAEDAKALPDPDARAEWTPQRVSFPKGETIYAQGDPITDVYLICKGKVKTSVHAGMKKQTLNRLNKGDVFGETALIDEAFRTESAEAEEDCEVLCLSRACLAKLVGSDLCGKILLNLVRKLRESSSLVEGFLFEDMLSKLIHALIFFYRRSCIQNGQTIEFADLTELLGLDDDRQVLRYLNKLESLNILQIEKKVVRVNNLGKLENLLCLLSRPGSPHITL